MATNALVRDLERAVGRRNVLHAPEDLIAYSKVCTHAGCPVGLYEEKSNLLLCPCHQSTFDAADHAKVKFGPADHDLPQLPLDIDDDGRPLRLPNTFPSEEGVLVAPTAQMDSMA